MANSTLTRPSLKYNARGNQRQSFLQSLAHEFTNLLLVNQQLAGARLRMVGIAAVLIGADVELSSQSSPSLTRP